MQCRQEFNSSHEAPHHWNAFQSGRDAIKAIFSEIIWICHLHIYWTIDVANNWLFQLNRLVQCDSCAFSSPLTKFMNLGKHEFRMNWQNFIEFSIISHNPHNHLDSTFLRHLNVFCISLRLSHRICYACVIVIANVQAMFFIRTLFFFVCFWVCWMDAFPRERLVVSYTST